VKEWIILKPNLPSCQRSRHTIEDYVISGFPNVPGSTGKISTKQGPVKIFFANKNMSEIEPTKDH
jgi:hypothetical protein